MSEALVCEAWDRRARGAMMALGVHTWSDLAALSDLQLLMVKGVGKDTLAYIKEKIQERGMDRSPEYRAIGVLATPDYQPTRGVYFVVSDGFGKIGHSKDVRRRFSGIAQMNPHPCELVAIIRTQSEGESLDTESDLHELFRDHHHRLEWFRYAQEIKAYVAMVNRP